MDVCKEKHKQIDEKFERHEKRMNNHGDRIDIVEQKMVGQEKDTTHLQNAINSLQLSIDKLIEVVDGLKSKPLEKYEKIAMVVVAAVISFLVGKWF